MDDVIAAKLPLARRVVRSYLRDYPSLEYYQDDLESAATVGLIEAIKDGVRRDSHLMTRMRDALSECVDFESQTIRVPDSTRRHRKNSKEQQGVDRLRRAGFTKHQIAGSLGITPDQVARHLDDLARFDPLRTTCRELPADVVDIHCGDPLSQILESCKSGREREIVTLRAARFTDAEIAAQIGVSRGRISQIVAEIERRYDADEAGDNRKTNPAEPNRQSKGAGGKCWCGEPAAKWSYGEDDCRCELHWADSQEKYHGRSQSVNTLRSAQPSFALSA